MPTKETGTSKLLEMAVKRYQFNVVGRTRFCTENNISERKILSSGKSESLRLLRIYRRQFNIFKVEYQKTL
jgi:hypothetical protein